MRTGIRLAAGAGAVTLTGQAVGGDLSGNWPNLQIGAGAVGNAEFSGGLARTKLAAVETRHVLNAVGEPALAAGWSAFEPVSFWLDPATERVEFQGILKRTGAYTSGGVVFTLPVGYRPIGAVNRDISAAKIVSSFAITMLQVSPVNGTVWVAENLVDQTFIYLDGHGFRP
jgi:hypothetical protein